jgi:hypothetical protein
MVFLVCTHSMTLLARSEEGILAESRRVAGRHAEELVVRAPAADGSDGAVHQERVKGSR